MPRNVFVTLLVVVMKKLSFVLSSASVPMMCVCVPTVLLCVNVCMLVRFPVSATQFLCHTGGGDETYPVREIQLHADGSQLFKMMMMAMTIMALVVSVVIQSDTIYLHNHF